MAKITVVIPTRLRARTIADTLRSCVEQPEHEGYQILVSDNQSCDGTKELVESFHDARIRYVCTPCPLSMERNWDFALSHVADGHVVFLGADDALFPRAIRTLHNVLLDTGAEAVQSQVPSYDWDNFPVPEYQQIARGYSMSPLRVEWVDSAAALRRCATNLLSHQLVQGGLLPNVYQGCVDVQVFRAHALNGNFFQSKNPDLYSAILVAATIPRYVRINQPVTLAARSGSSNAGKQWYGDTTNDAEARHFWENVDYPYEPELVADSANPDIAFALPLLIADQFLKVQKKGLPVPSVSIPDLLAAIVKGAVRWPEKRQYEGAMRVARSLASMHGLLDQAERLIRTTSFKPRAFRRSVSYFDASLESYRVVDLKPLGATGAYSATLALCHLRDVYHRQRAARSELGLNGRVYLPQAFNECLQWLLAITAAPYLEGTIRITGDAPEIAVLDRLFSPPSRAVAYAAREESAPVCDCMLMVVADELAAANPPEAKNCRSVFVLSPSAILLPCPADFRLERTLPVMVTAEEQLLFALLRWASHLPIKGWKRSALEALLAPIRTIIARQLRLARERLLPSGWIVQHWTAVAV